MDWKFCIKLTLYSVCCFISVSRSSSEEATGTVPPGLGFLKPCYVEWFKVSDLIIRMNQTVRIFSPAEDHHLQCRVNQIQVDVEDREACSDERIRGIQQDLAQVTSELFWLSTSKNPLSASTILALSAKKIQLIRGLEALRVFYGPSPCETSSIALYPFRPLVDHLDSSLGNVFKLFKIWKNSSWSIADTTSIPPGTSKAKTVDQMLSAIKSYNGLLDFARTNADAMTGALPEVVQQLFSANVSNFDTVIKLINDIPLVEKNKLVGYKVLYEELRRHSLSPGVPKLVELAEKLNELSSLKNQVSPLIFIGEEAECDITNAAYSNQQLVTRDLGWPESTYLSQVTSNLTWNFKSMGFKNGQLVFSLHRLKAPVYASDKNTNTHPNDTIYQISPSERYILRDEEAPEGAEIDWILDPVPGNFSNKFKILTAGSNYAIFAHRSETRPSGSNTLRRVLLGEIGSRNTEYEPESDHWILNCQRLSKFKADKSVTELLEMARQDPEAATEALPKLVPEMYAGKPSKLDQVVEFIKGLSSIESKIVGYSTVYQEIFKHSYLPSASKLVELADAVDRIAKQFAAAQQKLEQLDLYPLVLIGNKAECNIFNVAYPQQLITWDRNWPESAYLRPNLTNRIWEISPSVVTGLVTFRLTYLKGLVYASDTNPNVHPDDTVYQLQASERYVLRNITDPSSLEAEVHWKIVAVEDAGGEKIFQILTAKYNDILFAHDSAMGSGIYDSYRRVLLKNRFAGRNTTVLGSDLWKLNCSRSN